MYVRWKTPWTKYCLLSFTGPTTEIVSPFYSTVKWWMEMMVTVPVLVRYRTVNKLWWKNKTTVLVPVPYCYSIVPVTVFKHDFLFFLFLQKKIHWNLIQKLCKSCLKVVIKLYQNLIENEIVKWFKILLKNNAYLT